MEPTWGTSTGQYRPLPVIPGYELSGVVTEVGMGVTGVKVGDEVYARISASRDGAEAEYSIVPAEELALKPRSLTHLQVAAVPQSALTAWQSMFDYARLTTGQTILIHGASGGVGVFAVQLAHWAGAKVIATASNRNLDFIRDLGADETIDYGTTHFEEIAHNVDVVFDIIGGDTLK